MARPVHLNRRSRVPTKPLRPIIKIALRIVVSIAALVLATLGISAAFGELDWSTIAASIRSLTDADRISLLAGAGIVIAAQGLVTASTVPNLPVRRGVIAFLGPAAIASVLPGPTDLPVRYKVLQSWGYSSTDAGLAISAGGIFSIGTKLIMPVLAALVVMVTGITVSDGLNSTLLVAGAALVVLIAVTSIVLGSSRVSGWVAFWLQAPWNFAAKLMAREAGSLPEALQQTRANALTLLRDRWPIATWASVLFSAAQIGLMIMCLRFLGVPQEVLGGAQVFVAFGVVSGLTILPLTAGNVGITEAGWIGVLGSMAGSGYVNQVTAAVIIFRVLTWLVLIPLGGLALLLWRRSIRDRGNPVTPATQDHMSGPGR